MKGLKGSFLIIKDTANGFRATPKLLERETNINPCCAAGEKPCACIVVIRLKVEGNEKR